MKFRATAAFLLATIPLAAGCGSSGGNASSLGGKLFASSGCGSCHTLKAADAKGQVGPNLDELKPDASTVEHQVRVGGNGMPSFGSKLTSRQIVLVADFVADSSRSSGKVAAFKPDDTTVAGCERKKGGPPASVRHSRTSPTPLARRRRSRCSGRTTCRSRRFTPTATRSRTQSATGHWPTSRTTRPRRSPTGG